VDGVLAVLLLAAGFGLGQMWLLHPVLVPVMIALAVPVVLRREHPAGAFAAAVGAGALQLILVPWPCGTDPAIVVLLYTLAAARPRRVSLLGLGVCLLGAVAASARWGLPHHARLTAVTVEAVLLLGAVPLLAWLAGDSVRWRRGYYRALEERAERLEREREALAQVAAAAERARIAREVHDVVAHNVSVMVVQADGAAFALDSSPDKAREAIAAISQTGRQALTELRRLLGVLRAPGAADSRADLDPVPGIGDIGELVSQVQAAGIPVSFCTSGVLCSLPGGTSLAAYRVVQESLTNVRKHGGPGARAAVTLRYEPAELVIQVTDDGRGAVASKRVNADGAGHGLVGMRERVEMYGGRLVTGPRPGGTSWCRWRRACPTRRSRPGCSSRRRR
jgi:signal transduction histidine kinase